MLPKTPDKYKPEDGKDTQKGGENPSQIKKIFSYKIAASVI